MKTRWTLSLVFTLVTLVSSGCFRAEDSLSKEGNTQVGDPNAPSDNNSGGDFSVVENPLQPTCDDVAVEKSQIVVHGNGCNVTDVGLNTEMQSISIIFSDMQVAAYPESSPVERNRFCTLQIPVTVPQGLSVGMDTLELTGMVDFSGAPGSEASVSLETKFQWNGGAEQGPYKEVWYSKSIINPNTPTQPNPYLKFNVTSRNQAVSPEFSAVSKESQTKLLNITINMSTYAPYGQETYFVIQSGKSSSMNYRCIASNPSNKAPKVEGGPNQTVQFPYFEPVDPTAPAVLARIVSPIFLMEGAAADDDGLPLYPGRLTCTWKQINRKKQDCLVVWSNPIGDDRFPTVAPGPIPTLPSNYLQGHGLDPEFWLLDWPVDAYGANPCTGKVEVQVTCTDGAAQASDWKVIQVNRG